MSKWASLQLKPIQVDPNKVSDIVKALTAYLKTLADALDLILKLTATVDDPLNVALKKLIDSINKTVNGLLDDAGGYVLYVPIGKRMMTDFLGLGDITPNATGNLGIFASDVSTTEPNNPKLNEFIAKTNRFSGGNAGFYRLVCDSLYDTGDLNRPQFYDDDDYIGGITLMLGSGIDPLGTLDSMWALGGLLRTPDLYPKIPRPKNLKVKVLNHTALNTEATEYTFDSFLTWDPPDPPMASLRDLGGTKIYPERYAIIRCKNTTSCLIASNVVELLGTRNLTQGLTSALNDTEVIHESEYNPTIVNYFDKDIICNANDSFYYTVAWKLRGFNPTQVEGIDPGVELNYWYISNIVRTTPYPTLATSIAPDWNRTSSVASLFPSVATLLRRLGVYIEALAGRFSGTSDYYQQYVQMLRDEIDRYERIALTILSDINKMKLLFSLPSTGVYVRSFKGYGGNRFLLSDLDNSLSEGYDSKMPPFHNGDEFVTGAILLAGGPKPKVDAFLSALSLFFNTSSDASSELYEAINDLSGVLSSNSATFNADMSVKG
jgi:hypothetical protein